MTNKEERRQGIRDTIADWTHGPDWKTWIAHTVFGLIIAIIVGIIAAIAGRSFEFYGAAVAIGYYLIREIEQIVYNIVDKKPLSGKKAFDHFMDVAVPAAVILLVATIGLVIWG
jgi:hypothetical protein